MISVAQADRIIKENIQMYPAVNSSLIDAYQGILMEDLVADRNFPPFHKSLLDGIVINIKSFEEGQRSYFIEGIQAAGEKSKSLKSKCNCFEIMTGAVVPRGCDCVIPIEDVRITDSQANVLNSFKAQKFSNIRRKGTDHKKGKRLLSLGCQMLPPQIAVAASIGKANIKVTYKPKIAIISTGNELVNIDEPIKSFQIRKSNSYALLAAFNRTGFLSAQMFHLKDNKKVLLKQVGALLGNFDVLVLSGGVSMGKFDYVPEILQDLGVKCLFHKVAQKPGKPLWFGKSKDGKPVFGLPGNPISTQIGGYRYVIPSLKYAAGLKEKEEFASLEKDFISDTKLTYFLPVKLSFNKNSVIAVAVKTKGSGDLVSLVNSDGFMEMPENRSIVKKGFIGKVYRW